MGNTVRERGFYAEGVIVFFWRGRSRVVASVMSLSRKKSLTKSPRLGASKLIGKGSAGDDGNPAGSNAVRDRVRNVIATSLFKEDEGFVDSKEKALEFSTKIEAEMYSVYKGTTPAYKDKFRSINFNLKDEKNARLRSLVLSAVIPPETLLSMSSSELANPERKEQDSKIEKSNMRAAELFNPAKHSATTDFWKCGKCKQRKCTYYQLQTRSADEPLTSFVTCTVCNNRWKC